MINRLAELRREQKNGESGFTLIELLVVVVIIGVLIAIAVPLYLNYQKSSNDKASQSDVRNAISVLETCNSDNGVYPASFTAGGDSVAAGTATPCTGQSLSFSKNSNISYTKLSDTSYRILGKNGSGSSKWYCYLSTTSGSVKTLTAAPAADVC